MIFYKVASVRRGPPPDTAYPCAILAKDSWNDYGFTTTHNVMVYAAKDKVVLESFVKILERRVTGKNTTEPVRSTVLPTPFEFLDLNFCSLSGDEKYYETLADAGPDIYVPYLQAMRDVVFDSLIAAEFESVPGFQDSLLRSSEANKALGEAGRFFGRRARPKLLNFTFSCELRGADEPHEVAFDFRPHRTGLHRSTILIGRNGTGKTQYMAAFARAMSIQDKRSGSFSPRRPSFSRVIAVSFSAFDSFTRPRNSVKNLGYVYCGIRAEQRSQTKDRDTSLLTQRQIRLRLEHSLDRVNEQERLPKWREILGVLLEQRLPREKVFSPSEVLGIYDRLSSGQRMMVAAFTEIIAYIRNESVVLFDEPELHLHPDIFSALMRALSLLLKDFSSYAILATHAPLLLQETMARQVRVFRRQGNIPIISPLGIECFGENLTTITREVFEGTDVAITYREVLERLQKNHTIAQIEEMFPLGLPLQADAFLRTKKGRT